MTIANGKRNGGNGEDEGGEPEESEQIIEGQALPVQREEISIQIATAKRYPRNVTDFKRKAETMATLDEETAGSMFYSLPRAGRKIEGPSVRLAEVAASAWTNLWYGARPIQTGDKTTVGEAVVWDLETNNRCTIQVTRRITDSKGRRYSDDMITVTQNAAASVAFRQAVFKVIPFAYVKDIYEKAKEVSLGKGLSMAQRRQKALDWFAKFCQAKPEEVLSLVAVKSAEDLTVDDLVTLTGIKTAIQDGDTTFAQVLREAQSMTEREGTTVRPETLGAMVGGAQVEAQNDAPPSYPRATGPSSTPTTEPPPSGGDPFMGF